MNDYEMFSEISVARLLVFCKAIYPTRLNTVPRSHDSEISILVTEGSKPKIGVVVCLDHCQLIDVGSRLSKRLGVTTAKLNAQIDTIIANIAN